MAACGTTIFGASNQYIRILGGDFVAIEGANTVEKLITNDLRIPYSQLVKGKVVLNPGQVNYLLNFLGMGDNATFLIMKATYDSKSVIEEDNYIMWSFYNDLTKSYPMDQLTVLTGNSTHRINQIYLSNPNPNYSVIVEVMVANIDNTYSYFSDTINQSGTSFTDLEYTDIHSYVVGESIVIYDKHVPPLPLIYLELNNINSIQKTGNILTINDNKIGSMFLQFVTEYDAYQAQSLLNYVTSNANINIDSLNPVSDSAPPTVYFWSNVGNTQSGDYISYNGSTSSLPYNTGVGYTFSSSISLGSFGSSSVIDKDLLSTLLISNVSDNRDGYIILTSNNINILNGTISGWSMSGTMSGSTMSYIDTPGSYTVTFNLGDIANNYINGVSINLNITT